jgi:hypothetical protein
VLGSPRPRVQNGQLAHSGMLSDRCEQSRHKEELTTMAPLHEGTLTAAPAIFAGAPFCRRDRRSKADVPPRSSRRSRAARASSSWREPSAKSASARQSSRCRRRCSGSCRTPRLAAPAWPALACSALRASRSASRGGRPEGSRRASGRALWDFLAFNLGVGMLCLLLALRGGRFAAVLWLFAWLHLLTGLGFALGAPVRSASS